MIRQASHVGVQADTTHTTKVMSHGRLVRAFVSFECRDYAKIDCPHIAVAGGKLTPRRQRISNAAQAQCSREVVSTAARHNQRGDLQLDQVRKMAVHGTISAEDENCIALAQVIR